MAFTKFILSFFINPPHKYIFYWLLILWGVVCGLKATIFALYTIEQRQKTHKQAACVMKKEKTKKRNLGEPLKWSIEIVFENQFDGNILWKYIDDKVLLLCR